MHPRLTPANGTVAHVSLRGKVDAKRYVKGVLQQIKPPVADLLRRPEGGIDCQLLKGAEFLALETNDATGFTFGQSVRDGYVGYVQTAKLQDPTPPTHRVSALATHIYSAPHLKSQPLQCLPFGAEITVKSTVSGFLMLTENTYLPAQHLSSLDQYAADFVAVIESFTGTPYLWGGNTIWGMDCSGAVQLALHAAGQPCPRDTNMQEAALGKALAPPPNLERGDLVFWAGHVGVMTDATTLIHANAHSMSVLSEPLATVIPRIKAAGGGPVTGYKRL